MPFHRLPLIALGALALVAVTACENLASSDEESDGSSRSSSSSSSSSASAPSNLTLGSNQWFGPNGLTTARLAASMPTSLNRQVRMTLERTPGPWSITPTGVGSQPLQVAGLAATSCIRDQYIAAAMIGAYGTEYAARMARTDSRYQSSVTDYANTMTSSLRSAYSLCSNATSTGSGSCSTIRYISCDDLRVMLS